jgi:hypothetical protein
VPLANTASCSHPHHAHTPFCVVSLTLLLLPHLALLCLAIPDLDLHLRIISAELCCWKRSFPTDSPTFRRFMSV